MCTHKVGRALCLAFELMWRQKELHTEVPQRGIKPWVRSFFEKIFYEELISLSCAYSESWLKIAGVSFCHLKTLRELWDFKHTKVFPMRCAFLNLKPIRDPHTHNWHGYSCSISMLTNVIIFYSKARECTISVGHTNGSSMVSWMLGKVRGLKESSPCA